MTEKPLVFNFHNDFYMFTFSIIVYQSKINKNLIRV